jgi:3-hydroxyacyl-[acyl-carrier-protein] dehydratase
MLINDFFQILESNNTDSTLTSLVKINAQHKIFEGHFPNNPVTPGVVQIQIVKEILEDHLSQKLVLKEMGRCKFLAVLNPNDDSEIEIKISYSITESGQTKISAQGASKEKKQSFFKFNALYA